MNIKNLLEVFSQSAIYNKAATKCLIKSKDLVLMEKNPLIFGLCCNPNNINAFRWNDQILVKLSKYYIILVDVE